MRLKLRQRTGSVGIWAGLGWHWGRLRRILGVWLLVLLFGLGYSLAIATAARSEVRLVQVTQAMRPVEPMTLNGRLDESSSVLGDDYGYYNTHTFRGIAGQSIAIELESVDLEIVLSLVNPQLEGAIFDSVIFDDNTNGTSAQACSIWYFFYCCKCIEHR
jgi:hypothetical protein